MYLHKETNFAETRIRLANEGFAVKECSIANETCWLIFPPHNGIEWNIDNLIYRSGIWNDSGEPISLSWKKFFNWGERCDIAPKPSDLSECELINKEDGSTLLVSMYNGELVMRTRGTYDISVLDNGYEKDLLIKMYPEFFEFIQQWDYTSYTYVFEWETPSNRIVIDYGDKPRLVFTGQISHEDYSYLTQSQLDSSAKFFNLSRPPRYNFDSFDSMHQAMKELKGIEGIVCYFDNGQSIKKIKTEEYLMLHTIKHKFGYKALIDMVYEENLKLDEFKSYFAKKFDFEGLAFVEKIIDEIYIIDCALKESIYRIFANILYIEMFDPKNRKEFASLVFNSTDDIEKRKMFSPFLFQMYEKQEPYIKKILMVNKSLLEKFKKLILETVTK